MREVRMALLEADVNYVVVKDFIKKVTERCVGTEILSSLNAGQQVIKIVNEELTALMGGANARLTWSSSVPTIYMLCGLQGSGKTTMAGKLAGYLQKQGKKPLLAACDIYRPAAIKQLQVVGERVKVPVFEKGTQDPVITSKEAVEHAVRVHRKPRQNRADKQQRLEQTQNQRYQGREKLHVPSGLRSLCATGTARCFPARR